MAKYRVKLYFVHENEEQAARDAVAQQRIAGAEWTQGYVLGIVDEKEFPALAEQGLVIAPIEKLQRARRQPAPIPQVGSVEPPTHPETASLVASRPRPSTSAAAPARRRAAVRRLSTTSINRSPEQKIASSDPHRAQFYIVRFHGSLTEDRQQQLREKGLQPIERLSRNRYTLRLTPAQITPLAALPFVDAIRMYTEEDTLQTADPAPADATGKPIDGSAATPPPKWARQTCLYTARLHRGEDMQRVLTWLDSRGCKPLWVGDDEFRVALAENSRDLLALARLPETATVEQVVAPRLLDTHVRDILGIAPVADPPSGLEGEGQIIAIADTGLDDTHPGFAGRIIGIKAWGRPGDHSDPEGHGTHVAGCAAGDGSASAGEVKGAAPKAKIFFQSILDANGRLGGLPEDLGTLFAEAYAQGVRIHNNSWGAFSYAQYSINALSVDRFVAANPDMLVVIAAGNDGAGAPRANAKRGFIDWPSVASPAIAKNGLTVGASRSSRVTGGYANLTWGDTWSDRYPNPQIATDKISGDPECLAAFSSRGPSADLQFKPDVVAPGTDIAAARSKDAPLRKFWGAYPKNSKYGFMGGTSMAAPYVAGCAALVREWYVKKAGWPNPSAALLKATLINGTRRMNGWDANAMIAGEPNHHQGFGRIDMTTTVPNPAQPAYKLAFVDTWQDLNQALKPDGRLLWRVTVGAVTVGAEMTLRLCLVWTDPPRRGVQNTATLLVGAPNGKKYIGNSSAAATLSVAGAAQEPYNNVQVVRIPNPVAGDYTIAVIAGTLLEPPQHFALVVGGSLGSDLMPF